MKSTIKIRDTLVMTRGRILIYVLKDDLPDDFKEGEEYIVTIKKAKAQLHKKGKDSETKKGEAG